MRKREPKNVKCIMFTVMLLGVCILLAACGKKATAEAENTGTAAPTETATAEPQNTQDPGPSENPTPEPTQKEPEPYVDELYMAYDGELFGGATLLGDNANSIDGDHMGAGISWDVYINMDGIYTIKVFYFTPVRATLTVSLDEQDLPDKVVFMPVDGEWSVWSEDAYAIYQVEITKGDHTFTLTREEDDANYVAIGGISLTYGEIETPDDPEHLVDEVIQGNVGTLLGEASLLGPCVNDLDGEHVDSGVEWKLNSPAEGKATLRVYYYTTAENATLSLFVNEDHRYTAEFVQSEAGSWNAYDSECYTELDISLQAGTNTIRFLRTAEDLNFVAIGAIVVHLQ